MNTLNRLMVLTALTFGATLVAQPPRTSGLHFKTQELPIYPFDMVQTGVREGQVCIAFSVDTAGKVDDCLAVAYTRREFAEAAMNAIRRWTFEPLLYQGQPVATATQVTVNFEVQGTVVVSLTASEVLASWIESFHGTLDGFFPRTLRELDRIPTPLVAPAPVYPNSLVEQGHTGEVTVKFYIDEKGAVRLPAVDSMEDPVLAAIAIQAIHQWKFAPPTCKGRTVLTTASQVFRFRAAPKPVATASSTR